MAGWGAEGDPRAASAPGDQEAEKLGFEAVEAAEREGGDRGGIKGTWHSGEVERRALPRPQSERAEQRTREKGKSQSGQPGHNDHLGLSKRDASPQLGLGWMPGGDRSAIRGWAWLETDGVKSLERGLGPTCGLEGPAAQSFEHAHSACMVHLGTQALAGAAPPGPQSPLNGDLDLG